MTENNSNLDIPNLLEKDSEQVKDEVEPNVSDNVSEHLKRVQVVRSIVELLERSAVTEIKYRFGDFSVRVIKEAERSGRSVMYSEKAQDVQTSFVPNRESPLSNAPVAVQPPQTPAHYVLKSPMVGTAYLSPKPGDPPFVSVDSVVQEGQTVLIIEAMKTMNTIKAGKSGRVHAILVKNGDPVEFGQTLLHIE